MTAAVAQTPTHSFDDITVRLDEIVSQVRAKDTSLERSLDLFDEAIALGSRAVEMVDTSKLSAREVSALADEAGDDSVERDRTEKLADGEDDAAENPC